MSYNTTVNNNINIDSEIQTIFNNNTLYTLKRDIKRRSNLNNCNFYFSYIFYIFQSLGIIVTTISTGYHETNIIWVGVGFNVLASLVHSFEKLNNSVSDVLLQDIHDITHFLILNAHFL